MAAASTFAASERHRASEHRDTLTVVVATVGARSRRH
jgi:hypothetical protein